MTAAPAPNDTADGAQQQPYVLMKRGLYWRPNGQGYTGVLAEAGRYSEADARAHHDHDSDSTTMHLASECFDFAPACWPETQIAVLRDALSTAEAERDEADRRAGAAERSLEFERDTTRKRSHWLSEAKRSRGYGDNASFDIVWADTCAKADAHDALASELGRVKAALTDLPRKVEENVKYVYSHNAEIGQIAEYARELINADVRAALSKEADHAPR